MNEELIEVRTPPPPAQPGSVFDRVSDKFDKWILVLIRKFFPVTANRYDAMNKNVHQSVVTFDLVVTFSSMWRRPINRWASCFSFAVINVILFIHLREYPSHCCGKLF